MNSNIKRSRLAAIALQLKSVGLATAAIYAALAVQNVILFTAPLPDHDIHEIVGGLQEVGA
jgi:hypothetical protein